MNTRFTLFFITLILFVTSCQQRINSSDGLDSLNAERLKNHIRVLASDSLMGRMPLTLGEEKTIRYIEEQYKAIGLEPGNNDSYIQEVPMANILAIASPEMIVTSKKNTFTLNAFTDYVVWTNKTEKQIVIDKSELVFAGYGVVAPEYNWNDYKDLDVKNKIVLVMVNDPGFWIGDTSLFKGKAMTYYGRWTYKFEEAARQGAKGCIIIHKTEAAGYPFSVLQNNFNTNRLQLDNRNKEVQECDLLGWVTETSAKKLLQSSSSDTNLLAKANELNFKGTSLNLFLSTKIDVTVNYNHSHNVLGKITGTKYPDEVIIYTAHWDHFGIGKPNAAGDSIYNGAIDNASGVAALVELAQAFKSIKTKPERTIVFLTVTAEEQGLLGAYYYVDNPIFPIKNTIANINVDMLNCLNQTNDFYITGAGQSELEDYFIEELKQAGFYLSEEKYPEAGMYFRSDHLPFVKAGVPALFIGNGTDDINLGKEEGEKIQSHYRSKIYHTPDDEFNEIWKMEGTIDQLKILLQVGKRVAYTHIFPQWKSTSDYK